MLSRTLAAALAALAPAAAAALDVNVIGLFSGRAVIVVDRGAPRTLKAGERSPEGVLLVSADSRAAGGEYDGRRLTLEMGQHFESATLSGARARATLSPDASGHYFTDGQVNGGHVRFLVDTGATLISMSAAEATRLGIDYRRGQRGYSLVADGRRVPNYRVKLDSVSVGGLTLFNVEASIGEGGMGMALLGMSFLSRTEMQRDGQNLVLTKRY
ncbi:MAG TPA: TIGR02281 family clan AA aspartic protease [Myxococcota bacterium]|nr:TIGR02281 family clan AA aspartic protease [Myxococcota bacterium]